MSADSSSLEAGRITRSFKIAEMREAMQKWEAFVQAICIEAPITVAPWLLPLITNQRVKPTALGAGR